MFFVPVAIPVRVKASCRANSLASCTHSPAQKHQQARLGNCLNLLLNILSAYLQPMSGHTAI